MKITMDELPSDEESAQELKRMVLEMMHEGAVPEGATLGTTGESIAQSIKKEASSDEALDALEGAFAPAGGESALLMFESIYGTTAGKDAALVIGSKKSHLKIVK